MLVYILFILSPFAVTIGYSLYIWNSKTFSTKRLWIFASLLSLYLGLLNTTKEMISDIVAYKEYFTSVPQYSDIISYLLEFGKEPIYYGYTYISYYLFFGSWNLFIISLTIISYALISYSIITISKALKANIKTTITALFFMAFFFLEFAATSQAVRQAIAEAVLIAFFTNYYILNKKSWWIAICAVAIHSTVIVPLLIGLIPMTKDRLNIKRIILFIIFTVVITYLLFAFSNLFSGIPFLGYLSERSLDESLLESRQGENFFNLAVISLCLLVTFVIISLYYKMYLLNKKIIGLGFINLILFLLVFIISAFCIDAVYISQRYMYYLYAFIGIIALLYLHYYKFTQNNLFRFLAIISVIIYFFYSLENTFIKFIPAIDAIVYPAPVYFFRELLI